MTHHERFMRTALREAARGLGHTSPNPAVGAVVVKSGKIIARAHHRAAGLPHSEIEALQFAQKKAKGATLYVTLEPCSTQGRTPPCVNAIIAARVGCVVIGALDPNPLHSGRALNLLAQAGIEVAHGVLEAECRALNRAFNKWIVTKMPLVIAKAAMTLDGQLTRRESRWITGVQARRDVHKLRASVDAILIGAETLRRDNPKLTVRGIPRARQPWRVVMSRSGSLPRDAHVFTDAHRNRTLVLKNTDLRSVLADLGAREITSVLIEGGSRILGQAFDERLVDEISFYIASLISGGATPTVGGHGAGATAEALRILNPRYEKLGPDLRLTGEISQPEGEAASDAAAL